MTTIHLFIKYIQRVANNVRDWGRGHAPAERALSRVNITYWTGAYPLLTLNPLWLAGFAGRCSAYCAPWFFTKEKRTKMPGRIMKAVWRTSAMTYPENTSHHFLNSKNCSDLIISPFLAKLTDLIIPHPLAKWKPKACPFTAEKWSFALLSHSDYIVQNCAKRCKFRR